MKKNIDAKITINYILKRLNNDIVKAILQKKAAMTLQGRY